MRNTKELLALFSESEIKVITKDILDTMAGDYCHKPLFSDFVQLLRDEGYPSNTVHRLAETTIHNYCMEKLLES